MSVFVEKNEVKSIMITRRQQLVLMYKNVYFFTNTLNPYLCNVVVSLLQEFAYNGEKSYFVKDLPSKFWANIERKNEQYAKEANKDRLKLIFNPGDWVCVNMHKKRFLTHEKSKLQPSEDQPFKILKRINDNAYKQDLPNNYGNVSATFNVADLSLFDISDSRTNPFEEEGNNRDRGAVQIVQTNTPNSCQDLLQGIDGLITRERIKRMKEACQGLIMEVYNKEAILESSKIVFEISKVTKDNHLFLCARRRIK